MESRDQRMFERYYYWTEIRRLRFDDTIKKLSEEEFFVSESRVIQIVHKMIQSGATCDGKQIARPLFTGFKVAVSNSHQKALSSVVVAHIRRCGRLLFQDLLIYIDIYCHLLKAAGYSTTETKGNYALITKASVDSLAQYVKDSSTLCPIKESPVYGVISRLV